MAELKIAVAGSSGRMGRTLIEAVLQAPDMRLCAALEQAGSPALGRDAGELAGSPCALRVTDDAARALAGCDALIDFTRPEGTLHHLAICRKNNVRLIIGTTGFSAADKQAISAASRDMAIVMAPNMSVGTNVIFRLLETAARALGDGYDVEIVEAHHRHKVDAPSGTALRMGEIVAQALGRDLAQCAVYAREGVTGERPAAAIGFSAVRGGDIVGDHTVLFAGTGERVELSVKSGSRMT